MKISKAATKQESIDDQYFLQSHYCGNHTFIEATSLKDAVGFLNMLRIVRSIFLDRSIAGWSHPYRGLKEGSSIFQAPLGPL